MIQSLPQEMQPVYLFFDWIPKHFLFHAQVSYPSFHCCIFTFTFSNSLSLVDNRWNKVWKCSEHGGGRGANEISSVKSILKTNKKLDVTYFMAINTFYSMDCMLMCTSLQSSFCSLRPWWSKLIIPRFLWHRLLVAHDCCWVVDAIVLDSGNLSGSFVLSLHTSVIASLDWASVLPSRNLTCRLCQWILIDFWNILLWWNTAVVRWLVVWHFVMTLWPKGSLMSRGERGWGEYDPACIIGAHALVQMSGS